MYRCTDFLLLRICQPNSLILISTVTVSTHFFCKLKDSSSRFEGISDPFAMMEGGHLLSACVFDEEYDRNFRMKTLMGL